MNQYSFRLLTISSLISLLIGIHLIPSIAGDAATAHLSQPNRQTGLERLLGLGVVLPHPYFQKPRYRYPVYDRDGRGYLSYGYGGPETYKYRIFNSLEGHH